MASEGDSTTVREYVDAGGIHTYYEVEGSGEPLLLLHGGFCTIETFADLRSHLIGRYRVYLPERRAHGRTADVDGPLSYEAMAKDTIAFMEAINLPSAHVVGWSDGAIVGLLAAMHRPDLVRRLVMIGQSINHDGIPPDTREDLKHEQIPFPLPQMLIDAYAAVSPDGPEHWDVVVDKTWQMFRIEPNIPLSDLRAVTMPVLIMQGEHDYIVTKEHAEAMQQSLPDGRLVFVPGATHMLPMEQPAVVGQLIMGFLN